MKKTVDVLVSGGGVAGLTAAAAFGAAGFSVVCVDPTPPVTDEKNDGADMRSTAFLQTSRRVLEKAGLWDQLAPYAAPLEIMRIVDAGGETPTPRLTRDFVASEISDQPFGWNFPNWLLRREMMARLHALPQVDFRAGVATTGLSTRTDTAQVTLSDGDTIVARLVVGADGRDSFVRNASGISARTTHYGQKALAFAVTHPIPHQNVSTEVHRSGGPFTFVPLPDRDGRPSSAIVWMERGPEADRLAALSPTEFAAEATTRSGGIFGPLTLETRRAVWPMITRLADRFTAERVALVAEAAHVVPPIGAQGLNMSLGDLDQLLTLCEKTPAAIGDRAMLDIYARRRTEVKFREFGIDLLNRVSMVETRPLRDLRAGVLGALYDIPSVRRTLMRAGLGVR